MAGCVLASAALFTLGRAGHSGAVHVSSTLVVDAAGQRLSGFFDGLPSDPRNNIALLTLLQNPRRRCGDGFWHGLLERVERVAYAQTNPCNISGCDGACQGNYYVGGRDGDVRWKRVRPDHNYAHQWSAREILTPAIKVPAIRLAGAELPLSANTCFRRRRPLRLRLRPPRCFNDNDCK